MRGKELANRVGEAGGVVGIDAACVIENTFYREHIL
jgi:hypothetical protein